MASPDLPKAALYYFPKSIWSTIPLLVLEEKGYAPDEIDLKVVDLHKGEQYTPSYLRLNPNGTVPTLVVPLHKTLSLEIESRYKAIQDSKSIAEFLDKSRSTQSRTHTTSSAPSPSLSPATIAFSAVSEKVIALIRSDAANPNALTILNGHDEESLRVVTEARLWVLTARQQALERLLTDNESANISVSEKTRRFWETKKNSVADYLPVLQDAEKPTDQLDGHARQVRENYWKDSKAAWFALRQALLQLNQEIIGPYVLGDQLSLADLHLAAWLARLVKLSGGTISDDGNTAIGRIEAHTGPAFSLPKDLSVAEARRRAGLPIPDADSNERQNRLAAFWDAVKERPSFKKVYAEGLH